MIWFRGATDEPCPHGYKGCLVAPLVEIFSVTIHDKSNSDKKYRVYGRITVTVKGSETVTIYDRDKSDAELIVSGGALLLEDPYEDDHLVMSTDDVTVNFDLYYTDANCDILLAKDEICLDIPIPTNHGCCDESYESYVQDTGSDLKAKLQYALFPFAVSATIHVIYFSKDDDLETLDVQEGDVYDGTPLSWYGEGEGSSSYTANLYGTVSANVAVKGSTGETDMCSMLLTSTAIEDSVEVKSREFIELSRSGVAVPAYSSLEIEVSLCDCESGLVFSGSNNFTASCNASYKWDFVAGDGSRVRVRVDWHDAHKELEDINSWKMPIPKSLDSSVLPEQSPYVANCFLPSEDEIMVPLMEVFSVVVCVKDGRPLKFYGSVTARPRGGKVCIYNVDKSNPRVCPKSGILATVKGPSESYTLNRNFLLFLDFCDVSSDAIISRGFLAFTDIDVYQHKSMRMCSVVQGDIGFGIVYYEIMNNGVSARVGVKLNSASDGTNHPCTTVKGKIYAHHGNYQHPKCHQGNLFKSLLFSDEEHGDVPLDSSSSLPLLKSIVSLPRRSYLIIEVDLVIAGLLPDGTTSFKDDLKFYSNGDYTQKIAVGESYLEVCVNFAEPR